MVTRAGVSSDSSDSSTMAAGDGALAVLSAGPCKLCALIMKDKVAVSWAERGHCGDCGDWRLEPGDGESPVSDVRPLVPVVRCLHHPLHLHPTLTVTSGPSDHTHHNIAH